MLQTQVEVAAKVEELARVQAYLPLLSSRQISYLGVMPEVLQPILSKILRLRITLNLRFVMIEGIFKFMCSLFTQDVLPFITFIGTSLQVLPSLWSADFLQNWRQEIPQIIAQNS